MATCLSLLTISILVVVSQADSLNTQEDLAGTMVRQERSLHVEVLPSAPVLSEAWEEVENPEFLLVREATDKRSRNKRSPETQSWKYQNFCKDLPALVCREFHAIIRKSYSKGVSLKLICLNFKGISFQIRMSDNLHFVFI